jgi:hypothetical protein
MRLLLMQFSTTSYHFIPLRSKREELNSYYEFVQNYSNTAGTHRCLFPTINFRLMAAASGGYLVAKESQIEKSRYY